jgi:hypothetical protein
MIFSRSSSAAKTRALRRNCPVASLPGGVLAEVELGEPELDAGLLAHALEERRVHLLAREAVGVEADQGVELAPGHGVTQPPQFGALPQVRRGVRFAVDLDHAVTVLGGVGAAALLLRRERVVVLLPVGAHTAVDGGAGLTDGLGDHAKMLLARRRLDPTAGRWGGLLTQAASLFLSASVAARWAADWATMALRPLLVGGHG